MTKFVTVESPIMVPHTINVDDIALVEWDTFCRPAVRLKFVQGNSDIITRGSAEALVEMGAIPCFFPILARSLIARDRRAFFGRVFSTAR